MVPWGIPTVLWGLIINHISHGFLNIYSDVYYEMVCET